MPKAIELCQRQGLDAEFIIQIQHSGWEQRSIEAERALRALKNVRIVEGVLSSAEYAAWTSQIDVMLLPYDPIAFGGARGSGIFTESVAAGRPVIASRGTFAGASVENTKRKAKSSRPTPARHWPPPSSGLSQGFQPATPARRNARKPSRESHNADAYVDVLLAHAQLITKAPAGAGAAAGGHFARYLDVVTAIVAPKSSEP